MGYSRFEDLPVWNTAIDLAAQIYGFTESIQFRRRRSLRDQIERAAVSVSNNIAEGFERGTNKELLSFLYISRAVQPAKSDRCYVYSIEFRHFEL
jgi:hypothetical protein